MNAVDLMRQRMLEALAGQDAQQKKINDRNVQVLGDEPSTDQSEQFKNLPADIQALSIKGGQNAGRDTFAGLNPLGSYMRDANYENVDAQDQGDNQWEKIKALLGSKSLK